MSDLSYAKYNPQEKYKNYREDFSLLPKKWYSRSLIGYYMMGWFCCLLLSFAMTSKRYFSGGHWLAFLGLSILTLTVVIFKVQKNKASACPQCNKSFVDSYDDGSIEWIVCKNCEVKYYFYSLGNYIVRPNNDLLKECQVPLRFRTMNFIAPSAIWLLFIYLSIKRISTLVLDKSFGEEFFSNGSLLYGGLIILFGLILWGSIKLADKVFNPKSLNARCPQCDRNMELFISDRPQQSSVFAAACSFCNVKVYLNYYLKKITQFPDNLMSNFEKSSHFNYQIIKITLLKLLMGLIVVLIIFGIYHEGLYIFVQIIREFFPNYRTFFKEVSYVFVVISFVFVIGITYQFLVNIMEERYKCSVCKSPLKIYYDNSKHSHFIACDQCRVAAKKYL